MSLAAEEPLFGCQIAARRYDIGNKLEFLKATVEFGLRHADGGKKFLAYLRERLAAEK